MTVNYSVCFANPRPNRLDSGTTGCLRTKGIPSLGCRALHPCVDSIHGPLV